MDKHIFARNLRMIMGYRNIWIPELQYKSGLTLYELNNFISENTNKMPNQQQLEKIAKVLHVHVGTLLDEQAITINTKLED